MQKVQEIQLAVSKLSDDELATFRGWFEEFNAMIWDEQFENDARSGKLDGLADQSDFGLSCGEV